jgi:hypothetical protein
MYSYYRFRILNIMLKILLSFHLRCNNTIKGDKVFVTGSTQELGRWNLNDAKELITNSEDYPIWSSDDLIFEIKSGEMMKFEYKYFIRNKNNVKWENFNGNRIFSYEVPSQSESIWSYKLELNGENFNDRKTKPEIVPVKMHFAESQSMTVIHQEIKNHEIKQELSYPHRGETGQENNTLDYYLSSLQSSIEEIKNDKYKIKKNLNDLFDSLRDKKTLDKEFLILIFLHFFNTGQIKNNDTISSIFEHNHHHDSALAKSIYTYLLFNKTDENSLVINSILSYLPTKQDYRVIEKNS